MSAQELTNHEPMSSGGCAGRTPRGAAGVRRSDAAARRGRLPGARWAQHPGRCRGFTLVELMVAVVIIGVLVAIALPNFVEIQRRASEGSVKSNMHTVQMSVEDFGLLNDGNYPTSATATVPDGRTLSQVCPTGTFPKNPYTHIPSIVQFNSNPTPGLRGELAVNPADSDNYMIKGNGSAGDTLSLTLSSGQ